MNKKGSVQDILYIGIVLTVLAIATLVTYKVSDEINTKFQASEHLEEKGKTAYSKINQMYPGIIDNSFLFLAVGLGISAFIMAALVRIHPIFIALFIILLAFIIFLSAIFSNIYQEIAANPDMTALADDLTFISKIMNALPFIVGVLGSLLAILMYKSWQIAEQF